MIRSHAYLSQALYVFFNPFILFVHCYECNYFEVPFYFFAGTHFIFKNRWITHLVSDINEKHFIQWPFMEIFARSSILISFVSISNCELHTKFEPILTIAECTFAKFCSPCLNHENPSVWRRLHLNCIKFPNLKINNLGK